jgi:hypothetical protein
MKAFSKIIFTALFVFTASASFAPPPAPGGGMNPACWPHCVPIDNGLIFLIAAVTLYGVVKLYSYSKRRRVKI